ncbi:MAG: hypothetical protein NTU79_15215 [Planctomycetota bacterium]|nr:hypothetical protein [Planctomycetota bacterium]
MYLKSHISTVGVATTLIVCCLCQAVPLAGAELDEALFRRFQNEAPKAWKKQLELRKKFFPATSGVTIISNQKVIREGKVIQMDEYQEKRIRTHYRQMISKEVKKGEQTLQCANPRYAFELASSSSGEWVIIGVHPYQVPPSDESDNIDAYNRIMVPPGEIQSPETLPMRGASNQIEWFNDEVKIQDIKLISVNNRECFEVNIDFPFVFFEQKGNELVRLVERRSAVAVFDPTNNWLLYSFVWNQAPNVKTSYTASYDENLGGAPFMTSSRHEIRNIATNTVVDDFTYQSSVAVAALSERDFTLSAFGFPEPTLNEPPPYWLYSSLGGLSLVIIGGLLYQWGVGLRRS